MLQESELSFLCDVFQKSRVQATSIPKQRLLRELAEQKKEAPPDVAFAQGGVLHTALQEIRPRTVYRITDSFQRRYLALLLSNSPVPTLLFIGPYLQQPVFAQALMELGEKNAVPPSKLGTLGEYYAALPVIKNDSPLLTVFNTFCERLWQSPAFAITEVSCESRQAEHSVHSAMRSHGIDDAMLNIKSMEQRYAFENELIRAVSLGQIHRENQLFSAFSPVFFEKRVADPLRNAKNYAIIMNTLLRKAAEQGGVHPIHLNRVSSEFANKIEALTELPQGSALMAEMFRTYCRLVRKHAFQKFSPVVQRALLLIDSDLSADLSPARLASIQGISPGYFSTVFKKETGKTVTAYIRDKRMEYAATLLGTTNLQIQTVALHCGILDVQYFSKLFKRTMGDSPHEFRKKALGAKHPD